MRSKLEKLLPLGLSAALLGLAGVAVAQSWGDFEAAFPGLPCQDGWAGCIVDGAPVSPGMVLDQAGRPHPSDMRIGFFDFDALPALSPFAPLSEYTGEMEGAAADAGGDDGDDGDAVAEVDIAAQARAEAEAATRVQADAAREAEEASRAAAAAEQAAVREAEERAAAEEAARREAEAAARAQREAEAAAASAADAAAREAARKKAEEARKAAEEAARRAEEEARRKAEAEAARKAAEAEARKRAEEEAKKRAEAEAARKAAEEEARKRAEEEAARAAAEEAARKKAEADAAAAAAAAAADKEPVAMADPGATTAPPPASAAAATCNDLVALEVPAMMGQLGKGVRDCLEGSLSGSGSQTTKDKISRVLIADAEARRDNGAWEKLMKRHLEDIDRSDPNLCFKYALYLSRGGAGRAHGVIRWSDYALENKQQWSGPAYTKNVNGLYKLRAQAANKLWQSAEKSLVDDRSPDNEQKAERYRGQTKDYSREWLDYAKASGQDTSAAMALCVSAAGNREFCGG